MRAFHDGDFRRGKELANVVGCSVLLYFRSRNGFETPSGQMAETKASRLSCAFSCQVDIERGGVEEDAVFEEKTVLGRIVSK